MSLFEKLKDLEQNYIGVVIDTNEDSKPNCMRLVENSRRRLTVVAGELDPSFYCGEFGTLLKLKLDILRGYRADILFHKSPDKRESIGLLKYENKDLVDLFLDPTYADRMALYWASRRPRYHFIVADNSVYLEQADHPPRGDRRVYIKDNDPDLAEVYWAHFHEMVSNRIVERLKPADFNT